MTKQTEGQTEGNGWRGIVLVTITYVYFLIFAQFGFLTRLTENGIGGDVIKAILGVMAAGGISVSLLAEKLEDRVSPARRLQAGLTTCALVALLTLFPLGPVSGLLIAWLLGAAVGLTTVTLVAHLRIWMGGNFPAMRIGLGVGLAYFICNWPPLFTATPRVMGLSAALLCVSGALVANPGRRPTELPPPADPLPSCKGFWLILAAFTALVWLDSAAFYIIQHTPALKTGTWAGAQRLWQTGGIHLLAALGGAWLFRRSGIALTLAVAFFCLAGACGLLTDPTRSAPAAILYPLGVSIYSVALVAYPSWGFAAAKATQRTRRAGQLYAVAGWLGSGLGIGMAENLKRIPPVFILLATVVFSLPVAIKVLRARRRETFTTILLTVLAGGWQFLTVRLNTHANSSSPISLIEHGREVYIAEGCIHCHSQYVRPGTRDELMWGPTADVSLRRSESPPLIGNRRQGPDLTEVGNRRSIGWLRAHFKNPDALTPGSPMPNYSYLFADDRGDALLAYVSNLGRTNLAAHLNYLEEHWRLPDTASAKNPLPESDTLMKTYCATCHSPEGAARVTGALHWKRLPPDLAGGPFLYAPVKAPRSWRRERLAEIIKFGIPGTDMPGHEYLSDFQIAALVQWVMNPRPPLPTKMQGSGDRIRKPKASPFMGSFRRSSQ